MNVQRIGFSLMGEAIPLSMFLNAARTLSDLLALLDMVISGGQNLKWTIADLSQSSANLAICPTPKDEEAIDQSALVISSALTGLALVDKKAERPQYFTDETLIKAKELANIINSDIDRIAIYGNPGEGITQRIHITQRIAAHVDQLIGTSTVAVGEIEGTLETLTIHGGVEFAVYDTIWARRVRCLCDRAILDQLTDPTRLGKRILVKGEIRFNTHGTPTSVKVEDFRFLKDPAALPQVKDIRGLFAKNKIDLKEWAKQVRE